MFLQHCADNMVLQQSEKQVVHIFFALSHWSCSFFKLAVFLYWPSSLGSGIWSQVIKLHIYYTGEKKKTTKNRKTPYTLLCVLVLELTKAELKSFVKEKHFHYHFSLLFKTKEVAFSVYSPTHISYMLESIYWIKLFKGVRKSKLNL